jgi:hypothetical protein
MMVILISRILEIGRSNQDGTSPLESEFKSSMFDTVERLVVNRDPWRKCVASTGVLRVPEKRLLTERSWDRTSETRNPHADRRRSS